MQEALESVEEELLERVEALKTTAAGALVIEQKLAAAEVSARSDQLTDCSGVHRASASVVPCSSCAAAGDGVRKPQCCAVDCLLRPACDAQCVLVWTSCVYAAACTCNRWLHPVPRAPLLYHVPLGYSAA